MTTQGDSLLTAIAAGSLATTFSSIITYPFDSLKTRQQIINYAALEKFLVKSGAPSTLAQVMKGCSALIAGNVLKNGTRLILYNWASNFMAIDTHDDKKKTSPPRVVIAGAMLATFETMWITPFERIKITMVQNMLLANETKRNPFDVTGEKHHGTGPRYVSPHAYYTSEVIAGIRSGKQPLKFQSKKSNRPHIDALKVQFNKVPSLTLFGTIKQMYALQGLRAFTAGTLITYTRQIGSSAAWFSTYNATRQLLDPHGGAQEQNWFSFQHTALQLSGLHVISAFAVVALTQPLDVVKTHVQLKNGKSINRDSLLLAYRLVVRRGFRVMYAGAIPRALKIFVHGGVTAWLYSYFETGLNTVADKTVFTD